MTLKTTLSLLLLGVCLGVFTYGCLYWMRVANTSDRHVERMPVDHAASYTVYVKYCSPCHGLHGEGTQRVPKLKGTRLSVEKLSETILMGKGRMPAFGKDIPAPVADNLAEAVKRL